MPTTPARANFSYCFALIMSPNITYTKPWLFSFTDSTRPWLLTLQGCKEVCGESAELWSAQDTLFRFALWIMPAIVLIGHFHFPPLSRWNTVRVVIRLLGDPIDSIWSILMRQEINSRLFRRAVRLQISSRVDNKELVGPLIEAIAGIWTAYDEIGWGELPTNALERFERHGTHVSLDEAYCVLRAGHRLASNRSSSNLGTWIAIFGMIGALFAAYVRTWMQKLENQTAHTIAIVSMFFIYIPIVKITGDIGAFNSPSDAIDIILELRRDLLTCTTQSRLLEIFPLLEFHENMMWQKDSGRTKDLDIECPRIHHSPGIVLEPVARMAVTEVGDHNSQGQHWTTSEPLKRKESPGVESCQPASGHESLRAPDQTENAGTAVISRDLIESWPNIAPSLGMNIVFRPQKSVYIASSTPKHMVFPTKDEDRHPYLLLLFSIAFVVVGSYTPAFLLSYFTFWTVGFGCRCLCWTLILTFWVLSLLADAIMKHRIRLARRLWDMTVAKDSVVAAIFVGIIIWLQIGWVNNCWCGQNRLASGKMRLWTWRRWVLNSGRSYGSFGL
ncbi:hypothetical protein K469DRAFT_200741 [Zopfia rhizophila CBS 207.26]|uniref:Uncharacterized protein n=1 Tax=Zopfia rhizophila CBS 207.26 TaxID=1314779 RepID=A0A6A6DWY5_9PEZI|nr:hypothetical protein K469DRAFT_200741 [Zopfia rhizophila CBS 207.26]